MKDVCSAHTCCEDVCEGPCTCHERLWPTWGHLRVSLQLVALGVSGFTRVVRSYVVVPGDPCVSQGLDSQPYRSLATGPGPNCLTHLASQSFSFPCWAQGR